MSLVMTYMFAATHGNTGNITLFDDFEFSSQNLMQKKNREVKLKQRYNNFHALSITVHCCSMCRTELRLSSWWSSRRYKCDDCKKTTNSRSRSKNNSWNVIEMRHRYYQWRLIPMWLSLRMIELGCLDKFAEAIQMVQSVMYSVEKAIPFHCSYRQINSCFAW